MPTRPRARSRRSPTTAPRVWARRRGAARAPSHEATAGCGGRRAIAGAGAGRGDSSRARSAGVVSGDCGSGMRSRLSGVANAGKRANSCRRPSATCAPNSPPRSLQYRNGSGAAHSCPMKSSGRRGRQEQDGRGRAHRLGGSERGDPLAEGAVADLVVVLEESHEGGRRQRGARLAAGASAMRRQIALVGEPLRQAAAEMGDRRVIVARSSSRAPR